ncbi:MAG: exodeoxyribonuclease VII small subunit [Treponemataceae bacterium]|nr:exodeoxyribonuclease VII small subunit [Treponemataceae bacterium]
MENFEEKLHQLEELSNKIKQSDLPLEEAFSIFEKGIKLSKELEKDISQIENKVQKLINQPVKENNDEAVLDLFSAIEDK